MTKNQGHNYLTTSLKYGAMGGCTLLIIMLISGLGENGTLNTVGLGPYMVISTFIYLCQRNISMANPDINFGRLLGVGIICGLGMSLFADLYSSIYLKMINPSVMDQSLGESRRLLTEMGAYSEEQIDSAMQITQKLMPMLMIASNTITYTIVSLLFGALGAWLNRKRTNK